MRSCHFHAIIITAVHASWACCNLWTKKNVLCANRCSQNDKYILFIIYFIKMSAFSSWTLQVYPCTAVDQVVKTYVKLHRLLQSHLEDVDLPILSQGIMFFSILFSMNLTWPPDAPPPSMVPRKEHMFRRPNSIQCIPDPAPKEEVREIMDEPSFGSDREESEEEILSIERQVCSFILVLVILLSHH